ncbi:glucose-1-phosphate adenylyltransferase [Chitinophaga horti]|uniref:Glucose-1-phosphate adenylyltransferase n=1 Tax=Chitinophaga horti TaxID=2920382 RepID=A0ABY6J5Q5_9BACT|nr:glucose-1-phosphate adenylyltransferase [Chitinophaga horti]UYQ94681.1 glucose-1-phosphate adenylyltransferase [Chitinophaga horti]
MSNQVISVILGGGAGTRLYPLTRKRSKPAVPVGGKYRLVDIPISNCLNADLHRIFVLTQFNSASLNKHIKNTYFFSNFSKAFVDILAAEQTPDNPTWYQGTADAVRQSLHHLENFEFDYVLILSGDQLYQMDFCEMIDHHIAQGADISIATIPVNAKDATDFGILKTDDRGFIHSFTEKPKTGLENWTSPVSDEMDALGRRYLASMGIYIFNRKLLFDMLLETQAGAADFGKEILPYAIQHHKVLSFQYTGYWTDIGNISSFWEANLGLTDEIPQFNLFDEAQTIYSRARMLPPAKVSVASMERAVISDGCIVQAKKLERVVLGIRTRVGIGSEVTNTYIMGNDFFQTLEEIAKWKEIGRPLMGIGENCVINNAIIDKNACIGNNVHINGGPHLTDGEFEKYTVKDGIVVVKKGAVLPDGFTI